MRDLCFTLKHIIPDYYYVFVSNALVLLGAYSLLLSALATFFALIGPPI
ncbi:MAG TPA: hypothetical protein VN844_13790 [Pyrinomonadaceae bacterium]|nr:hypothetical protein [Pyrinomonadaceae bacterium]